MKEEKSRFSSLLFFFFLRSARGNAPWRHGREARGGAGPQLKSVRVRNIRLFLFLEYDSSVADILSGRPERMSAKKGPPPSHCGLKFWLVTTLRATRSLRSLKQALRLTPPARISPFGHRPPFKWAGSCTSTDLFLFRQCGGRHISIRLIHFAQIQMRRVRVKYAGAAPHPSLYFPACPWKICVAASRLPCLLCLCADGAQSGKWFNFQHMTIEFWCRTLSRASLMRFFLIMKKRTHIRRIPFSSYVGLLLCLRYISEGEPP